MPRPAIYCGYGTLKEGLIFYDRTILHVEETPSTGDVREWRCCASDGIYCGPELLTPHRIAVPEFDFTLGILVGILLLGALLHERSRSRRQTGSMRTLRFSRQRRATCRWLREVLRRGLRLVGVR